MGLQDVDMISAMRRLADRRIEQAMEEGKFENLAGKGQPIDYEDMPPGEEARMRWWALRILKNADFIPEEVAWRKSIDHLKANLAKTTDAAKISELVGRINELAFKVNNLGTNALSAAVVGVDLEQELLRAKS